MRIFFIMMDLSKFTLILRPILSSQHLLTITSRLIRKICSKILSISLTTDCFALEYIHGIYIKCQFGCFPSRDFIVFTVNSCNNLSLRINVFYKFR